MDEQLEWQLASLLSVIVQAGPYFTSRRCGSEVAAASFVLFLVS